VRSARPLQRGDNKYGSKPAGRSNKQASAVAFFGSQPGVLADRRSADQRTERKNKGAKVRSGSMLSKKGLGSGRQH
jgi:hypothetical protein